MSSISDKVHEIGPDVAFKMQTEGSELIDIRNPAELIDGTPLHASNVPVDRLLSGIKQLHTAPLLICRSGRRSMETALTLAGSTGAEFYSVCGGFDAWQKAGLPIDRSGLLDEKSTDRYRRQLVLPEVGPAGQKKLTAAKVLVIGAGGLGSPVLTYLAAAGVGCLGVVDDDRVDRSNLQRQILHRDQRVGELKTNSAKDTLLAINPDIRVNIHDMRVTVDNARELLNNYDIVVDGSDNLPTRYLLNDCCVDLRLPLVYGAVLRFEGQVSVFWPAHAGNPCYRCLFPDLQDAAEGPSCSEAGVIGVTPAVIGSLQATEVIKILLGVGDLLTGRLLSYDALAGRFREAVVSADPECISCSGR